ncbi:MAG: hypothetical protein QGD94_02685, partial [Planctomycetia bacterium]|nr:hypothetical protein [Planctomycetia bacterium]
YATSKGWRKAYDAELKNRQMAEEARDNALVKLGQEMEQARSALNERQVKISTLETQVDDLKKLLEKTNSDLAERDRQVQELSEQITGINKSFEQLVQEKNKWQQDRTDALNESRQLRAENDGLIKELIVVKNERATLHRQALYLREKVAELEKEVVGLRQVAAEELVVTPPPVPKIEGMVTLVGPEGKTAQVNVGKDDSVREGMEFTVFRSGKFLAVLTITKVTPSSSAGNLSLIQGAVRRKDNVSNSLKP